MNSRKTKPTEWASAPAFAQSDQNLRCPPYEGSVESLATHKAHSEDSDQTGRMPRLI